ncbi:unnamed protein product [Closterium sp. NIES-65]|nr:unnamed protein product [Closterium sp. NIES-65]
MKRSREDAAERDAANLGGDAGNGEALGLGFGTRDDGGARPLLQKAGWHQGRGLGVAEQGRLNPVPPSLKFDKVGLGGPSSSHVPFSSRPQSAPTLSHTTPPAAGQPHTAQATAGVAGSGFSRAVTDALDNELDPKSSELLGVLKGSFVAHASLTNKKSSATLLNPSQKTAAVTINRCCVSCSEREDCAYWTWKKNKKSNTGICSLFGADQCSTHKSLAKVNKWQPDTSTGVVSFKRCLATSSSSTGAGSASAGEPLAGTDSTGSGDSSAKSGGSVKRYNTTCPAFPCLPACPSAVDLPDITDSKGPAFPGAFRGKLYEHYSQATGPTLVEDAGLKSIGECCEYAASQFMYDVTYWSWEQSDSTDSGRCKLFSSQACASQRDESGNLPVQVFDPTFSTTYAFRLIC